MKLLSTLILGLLITFNAWSQLEPLIQNNWQTFQWPYNAYYPEDDQGVNGHAGNACGYTAMARILHYWQYPINGNGVLDFDDFFGHHWYIDLENMDLDYSDMPYELDWNDPEDIYHETAMLFLACGAIGEDIMIGFTDGIMRIPQAMQDYMYYSEEMDVLQRWDYTREEWIEIFKNELDQGRPILIDGRTPDSPPPWEPGSWQGHFFVCDGYNENDEFYTNYMYGGISGYYDIDTMDVFSAYHRIIVNYEPFNVGMDQNAYENQIQYRIFPNPVHERLNVSIKNSRISKTQVELINSQGSLVRTIANRAFWGEQNFQIDTQELKPGIYFLRIYKPETLIIEKVLICR
ncbi:MAG: C10 family peptidase [Bacteroidales bacterium]|nr:C10 family peptidase [Bacteroidales bacterium]MCF8387153.1 C10 family peptidase [Bacteroidales bacterium]MCF8397633.1 C10 family peptidase [Bacteroidales bacterium]